MRQYEFGECIPESINIYNRLKKQGKNPIFIEGWVEVQDPDEILEPNYDFLKLFYPKQIKVIKNGSDYARVLPHTFIICDGKIIDKTRNQFDRYNGVILYYEKCRYWFLNKVDIDIQDVCGNGVSAIFRLTKRIHYPIKKNKNFLKHLTGKRKKYFYHLPGKN